MTPLYKTVLCAMAGLFMTALQPAVAQKPEPFGQEKVETRPLRNPGAASAKAKAHNHGHQHKHDHKHDHGKPKQHRH